jgi:uncharacterized phage protein (TIGR02218 family)
MPRYIPIALQESLAKDATTTCLLIRIDPVVPGGVVYGATSSDQTIVYDDGRGDVTYHAPVGMMPPAMIGHADMTSDQAQSKHLFPEYDIPELSEEAIRAGVYDFAKYDVYLVDYANLSAGHVTLKSGTTGQKEITDDGLAFTNELRDLSAALKQSICEKDSLTCRAIFGSQPIGSSTPGQQVTHGWCGFDATSLLVADAVLDVGAEPTLTFQVTADGTWSTNHLVPGIVKFTSGQNNGRTYEIAGNSDDGWITLAIEAGYPIADGDDLEYRPDCSKVSRDDAKGCRHWFEADWILHFRGEPDIPIGDENSMFTPGNLGAPNEVPFDQAPE